MPKHTLPADTHPLRAVTVTLDSLLAIRAACATHEFCRDGAERKLSSPAVVAWGLPTSRHQHRDFWQIRTKRRVEPRPEDKTLAALHEAGDGHEHHLASISMPRMVAV